MRLTEYETSLCSCGCGLPIAEAHKKQSFVVDEVVCQARRALDQVIRRKQKEAEDTKRPDGWDDGLRYSVRPATPEDLEKKRKR
jgi:hypothetical protein